MRMIGGICTYGYVVFPQFHWSSMTNKAILATPPRALTADEAAKGSSRP